MVFIMMYLSEGWYFKCFIFMIVFEIVVIFVVFILLVVLSFLVCCFGDEYLLNFLDEILE